MMFAKYGGGNYNFVAEASWNGLHIADLVFPCFLWIMGVCIPMSIKFTIKAGTTTEKAILKITKVRERINTAQYYSYFCQVVFRDPSYYLP